MSGTISIQGPVPNQKVTTGTQSFFIHERPKPALSIDRKITLTWQLGKIVSATCTCTSKATLYSPCSHIQGVLEYVKKINLPPQPSIQSMPKTHTRPAQLSLIPTASVLNEDCDESHTEINSITQVSFVIKAVQHEILAIQTSQNVKQILISNGKLIGSMGESYRYKFDLSDEFRSPAETPIELNLGTNSAPITGTILRCEPDNFIEIAIDQFQGDFIGEAKLISRLDFIWKAAEKRLTELSQIPNLEIFKEFLRPIRTPYYDNTLKEDWGGFKPDDEQRKALLNCLGQKIAFVYGPPGTGKSQTIGWLAKELIRRGEKIIIASHTNIAVDNALQKVCETKEGNLLRENGDIIRLGEPLNQDLEDLRIHNVISKKSKGLQDVQTKLKKYLLESQTNLNSCQEEINILEKFQNTHSERARSIQELEIEESSIKGVVSQQKIASVKLATLEKQLQSRDFLDLLFWVFRRNEANNTKATIASIDRKLASLLTRKKSLQEKIESADEFLQKNNISTDPKIYSNELFQLKIKESQVNSAISELNSQIDAIQEKLNEIAKSIYSQVKIIGVTLSKLAIDSGLQKFQPENLIIDELSTSPFPLVLVALTMPSKRAILFGDPNQLPPISISDTQCSKLFLRRDAYEIIPHHKEVSTKLTVQRRMPESIVEFVNSAIYNGELSTDTIIAKNRDLEIQDGNKSPFKNPPFKDHQVIFVDTSSINPWCALDANQSKYNLYSAHIVSEIIAREIGNKPEWKDKRVGIICPYRAQKQLVKKLVQARLGLAQLPEYLDVHTVDAFQGEQRDIIILDLTSGQPSSPGIRLSEKIEKEIAGLRSVSKVRRLLNVAMTRTKYQLVIIANKKYYEREFKDTPDEYVLEIIQRASGDKVRNDLKKFHVWIDGEDLLRGESNTSKGYSPFLDENNFYQYLKQDFSKATSSVVIVSPFVTQNRVQDLKPHIQGLLQRRVNIWIVTRPVEDAEFGVNALMSLQELGCVVKQRKRTHEKIVIIDNKIAYYGSLNVLSHKDTKEVMHRIQGEQVGQLLQQFIDVIGFAKKPHILSTNSTIGTLTREECSGKLKHLRWKIASQRHIPQYAVLYNQTIEEMLNNPPQTEEALYELLQDNGEKQMKHLNQFLDEILSIVQRYRQ